MRIYQLALLSFLFLFCANINMASAQNGHEITIELSNFKEKVAYLAYYYGDKPYIRDTVEVEKEGTIVFKGEEELEGGIYLVVLPPENQFVQMFVSKGDQHFTLEVDAADLANSVRVKGSLDNQLFYEYMDFLGAQIKKKEAIQTREKKAGENKKKLKAVEADYKKLDDEVIAHHNKVIKEHPKTMTAVFMANRVEIEMPDFEGTDDEIKTKQWQYVKDHYFDNLDLSDPRLTRSPFFYHRVQHYIEKLTVQHPDSIPVSIDKVLNLLKGSDENFKFYLVHFLNTYAKSKIVGMDAVYVHIVENYYAKGLAPWTDKDQLKKIIRNANTLKPLLIGKIAPDIEVEKQDKSKIKLHDVDSDITVLFFWAPDCGHCKKSMPKMVDFYDKYQSKGVEVFAVCTMVQDKCKQCWETIEEKNMDKWINTTDPFLKSRYKVIYDIRTTPQIYVLDKNKEIVSKRIGAEQLGEVIDSYLKYKEKEKKKDLK